MSRSPLSLLLATLFLCPASARAAGKIEIECPLFKGGSGSAFYLKAAREYEKIKPNVKVNLWLDPRVADKVQVRLLEGSYFETTNVQSNFWPVVHNGGVVQLDQFLDGPSWDTVDAHGKPIKWKDTFLPGALDLMSEDGKHYGVPLAYYATVIWYNKKMFREHGWKPTRTWDEFFALCQKIKDAGIPPLAFQGKYAYYALSFYDAATYQLDGPKRWMDRQYLVPGTINDAASVQAITWIRRLANNYFQPGALGMTHTESQMEFFLGHTAMISCGSWLKSEMKGKIPDDFELGCFNLPIPDHCKGDPTAVKVGVEPFVFFKKSKHPDVAIDFIRFMTSKKMAGLFSRMQDIPSAIRGANEGNLSPDLNDLMRIVENAKASYGAVPGQGYPKMFQVYTDMMYDIIAGKTPPRQLADHYEQIGQTLRQQALHPDEVEDHHPWRTLIFLSLLALGAIYCVGRAGFNLKKRLAPKRARTHTGLARMRWSNALLFVGPAVLIYTLFVVLPSLQSFSWSLHQWNGLTNMNDMPFKGLLNFKRLLLEGDDFWIALNNNLFLMFVVPAFVIPLSMFLAATISRGVWGGNVFRIVFFFPNLLGGVAATLLWLQIYNPQGGLVNPMLYGIGRGLSWIGLSAIGGWFESWQHFTWLEANHVYWSLIPISIWGAVGFNMILYLAAMEGVPESFYEAATLDGASNWRQYWTITLPLIWDILAISVVFMIIGGMKAFDVIWLLCNQAPQTSEHVIATKMVQSMFKEYNVGEAAALAVLLFLMVFIGSTVALKGMKREAVEM